MPCILSKESVSKTLNIPLNEEEARRMYGSVKVLKEFQKKLGIFPDPG